jgi:hypothetical protein
MEKTIYPSTRLAAKALNISDTTVSRRLISKSLKPCKGRYIIEAV